MALVILVSDGMDSTLMSVMAREENIEIYHLFKEKVMQMIKIPRGKFLCGDDKQEKIIDYDYYMDIFPVTNKQYKEFIDANMEYRLPYREEDWAKPYNWDQDNRKYPEGKANHPVVLVSYYDAQAYCKWRTQKEGLPENKGYRLPTEEEWEKAARGTDGRIYPWGDEFDQDKCNCNESGFEGITEVTSYPNGASPYGCYDMAGNVAEWTDSWYDKDRMVLRGGAWGDNQRVVRCAFRFRDFPDDRYSNVGFRCARRI